MLMGSFLLFSCNKDEDGSEKEMIRLKQYLSDQGYSDIEQTESGFYHIILNEGEGANPLFTDFIRINFTGSLIDGTVFETSDEDIAKAHDLYHPDRVFGPAKFELGRLGITGLVEGILLMKQGETSRIIIPSKLGFGSSDHGIVPPYSTLIYDVELLDVIRDPEKHEQRLLEGFLAENNIQPEALTESGFYYIEKEEGTGSLPRGISIIDVHAIGTFLDGRVFYSTYDSSPLVVYMDKDDFIPAFQEGLMKMKKGGKSRLVIPWDIAYGEGGSSNGVIPPYSTLVFDLEVLAIQ